MARTSYFTGFPLNQSQTVYVEDVIRQLRDLYTNTEEILDATIIASDAAAEARDAAAEALVQATNAAQEVADAVAGTAKKNANLSDLDDPAAARDNISAAGRAENLSDLSDLKEARSNLGTFSSVAEVQSRHIPPVLDSIRTNGYYEPDDGGGALYVEGEPTDPGAIQSADGRWWRHAKQPSYNAAQFGFAVSNDAEANRSAMLAMLDVAQGSPCYVHAESDFECAQIEQGDKDVDLTFTGRGRWLRLTTANALRLYSDYDSIQSATLSKQTTNLDGSNITLVRIAVSDASNYSRGDLIRIVSDDIDPDASESTIGRRRGEFAQVVKVDTDSGYIWVPNAVEDFDYYQTNVRIGRLIKRRVSIKNLRILSNEELDRSQVIYLRALYRPYIDVEIEHVPWIAIQLSGCFASEIHFRGSGKADSSGSLGYGINDSGGQDNTIYPRGRNFRHLTTTGFPSTEEDGPSLYLYGATRGHTVINGFAESSQSAPFDAHPGCRGTRWVNCKSVGLAWVAGNNAAFNCRGTNSSVINPYVDATHAALIRHSRSSRGVTTVLGGRSFSAPLLVHDDEYPKSDVVFDGLVCSTDVPVMFDVNNTQLTIRGGVYESTTNSDFRRMFDVRDNATVILDGPEFVWSGTGASFRILSPRSSSAKIIGSFRGRSRPGASYPFILRTADSDGSTDAVLRLAIVWLSGNYNNMTGDPPNDLLWSFYRVENDSLHPNTSTLDELKKIVASMA